MFERADIRSCLLLVRGLLMVRATLPLRFRPACRLRMLTREYERREREISGIALSLASSSSLARCYIVE